MRKIVAENGSVKIVQVKEPKVKSSYILVKTMYSAISPGTELSMIRASEGKQQSIGYSAMGIVIDWGEDITDVEQGDFVACYGAPYVHHAEYLLVPKTLYTRIHLYNKPSASYEPKQFISTITPQEASLGGIGAIAIHALRIARLSFGESVVIVGLGVLGQMIAKIANAASYNVIAYDLNEQRTEMLDEPDLKTVNSLESLNKVINKETKGNGADAVLLCTGGKKSPLSSQSLEWIRDRGKVVIVGDIEPDFPRNLMFAKEAEILISRAGGPGRYDEVYESRAIDYPYGHIRWTEGRNLAEYIRLVSNKKINVSPFLHEEIPLSKVEEGFKDLFNNGTTSLTKIIRYEH